MGIDVKAGLVLVLLALTALSCDQETEGCLDFRALSVELGADNACEDCCEYPEFVLQLLPAELLPDTLIRITNQSIIAVSPGDSFRVLNYALYLSDIGLELEDGSRVELTDTLSFRQNSSEAFAREDVSLLRFNLFGNATQRIGALLETRRVTGVSCRVGLPPQLAEVRPFAQIAGGLVAPSRDSLLLASDNLTLAGATVQLEYPLGDTLQPLRFAAAASDLVTFQFDEPLDLLSSYNLFVTVGIDVSRLPELTAGNATLAQLLDVSISDSRVTSVRIAR